MGAENIACETETCMLDEKSIAERLSMTVNILERYLQTRRGARGNLLFDTSYREAAKACAPFPSEEKNHPLLADKSVRFWQGEALSHFRKSSWEDVVSDCNKVMSIPGQSETNNGALFLMGYAYMRLKDYCSAAELFLRAYRIDSQQIALRLVMHDLTTTIVTKPYRKRSREDDTSDEQRRVTTRTSFSHESA